MSYQSVPQECPTRVSRKSVPRERPATVSHKTTRARHKSVPSVPLECPTRVSRKSVRQEFPTRVSHKSVSQECPLRVSHSRSCGFLCIMWTVIIFKCLFLRFWDCINLAAITILSDVYNIGEPMIEPGRELPTGCFSFTGIKIRASSAPRLLRAWCPRL